MSISTDLNSSIHHGVLSKMYFDIESKTAEGKVKCRKCDAPCKDNSGHGNLVSHIKQKHASCWRDDLKEQLQGATRGTHGAMDSFVTITKIVSDEAKNMSSWIEWSVETAFPITVVENEQYRKYTTLKPTTYKTVSKYMTSLFEIVKRNIAKGLPKTFGIIFDGKS